MSESEHESDFSLIEDEDLQQSLNLANKKKTVGEDVFARNNEDNDDFSDEESDTADLLLTSKTNKKATSNDKEDEKVETVKEEGSEEKDIEKLKAEKLARLKKLKSVRKTNHKTGVVYLSKIPPYMKPAKMRQVLTRFGEVDRLFLKREDESKYKQRIHGGGNKKTMYTEGWAEYIKKKDAKLCAFTLNGNILGGKKGSFYYDDVMNIKYLSGFKWSDLTEQIAKENDIRQSKLELEISQANKLNAEFIRNVEKSKMINNIRHSRDASSSAKQQKRKLEQQGDSKDHHVGTKQRKIITNRINAPEHTKKSASKELNSVLSNLF